MDQELEDAKRRGALSAILSGDDSVKPAAALVRADFGARSHRYEVAVASFDDRDLGQFNFHRIDVHLQMRSRCPTGIACWYFGLAIRATRRPRAK